MSVDVEALKVLAAEKKLPLERLINAIENEVATAYASLPGAKPHGRAVLIWVSWGCNWWSSSAGKRSRNYLCKFRTGRRKSSTSRTS